MRRFLSLTLVVLFSCWLILPLFASGDDGSLPACCRHGGMHHCAGLTGMTEKHTPPSVTTVRMRCALYPAASQGTRLREMPLSRVPRGFAGMAAQTCDHPQTRVRFHVSFNRARQKRGPPGMATV